MKKEVIKLNGMERIVMEIMLEMVFICIQLNARKYNKTGKMMLVK